MKRASMFLFHNIQIKNEIEFHDRGKNTTILYLGGFEFIAYIFLNKMHSWSRAVKN